MASTLFKDSVDHTSTGYKVVLSYLTDVGTKYAEIDVQEGGIEVRSNMQLSSFPTLQGYNVSDHVYREPIEVNIKGEFADNGLKAAGWIGDDRLSQIQAEFEACQRSGTKFNIVTIGNDDASSDSNRRFLRRKNMVLTGISWTQQQHSMSFSFNFKEAISSSLQIVDVRSAISDPNLPAITELSAASLVGEVISSNSVIMMTIDVLKELNLVNDATFQRCMAIGAAAFVASNIAAGAVVGSIMICIFTTTSSIPVVGWIVGAAIAVAAAVCAVFAWVQAAKRAEVLAYYRSLGHVFLIEDDMTENEKDEVVNNFVRFLAEVKNAVDTELNDIAVYRIAKADRQECTLNVNGTYYVQRIEKNDDDLSYRIECLYLGQKSIKAMPRITALESFEDCTNKAAYFHDSEGTPNSTYRVYIISRSAYKQEMSGEQTFEDKLTSEGYGKTDVEKYIDEKNNLLDFAFVVAPYALTNLSDKISDVIKKVVG